MDKERLLFQWETDVTHKKLEFTWSITRFLICETEC